VNDPGETRAEAGAEPRWPPIAAVVLLIVLNLVVSITLGAHRGKDPRWLIPGLEGLLLLALLLRSNTTPLRSARLRRVSIVLVGLLVAAALWGTAVLIFAMIRGGKETQSAGILLAYGAFVWIGNNIAFSLMYWEFDGGGPMARALEARRFPDFAFPQQQSPELAPPGWRPLFWDYLYLGFNNSVAFSPTDAMPLARWAKLAMGVQAIVSLAILGLVIARAVNVFK